MEDVSYIAGPKMLWWTSREERRMCQRVVANGDLWSVPDPVKDSAYYAFMKSVKHMSNFSPHRALCKDFDAVVNRNRIEMHLTYGYDDIHEGRTVKGLSFTMETYERVRPGKPRNLSFTSTSPNKITVSYNIPYNMEYFPPGLNHRVKFRSEFDDHDIWHNLERETVEKPLFDATTAFRQLQLRNVTPHANYTFKIQLISAKADPSDDRLWSPPAFVSGLSPSKIPKCPPKMAMGSFEVIRNDAVDRRHVFIYWRQIPIAWQNGPGFRYVVTKVLEGNSLRSLVSTKVTAAYAEFVDISSLNHTFYVTSKNRIGKAVETKNIYLPAVDQMEGLAPRSLTKIDFRNNKFEVSWLAPVAIDRVDSFTLFWCLSEKERPYQCQGQLDWINVSKEERVVNISVPSSDIYQFAVAGNTIDGISSGMHWATCTVFHDKVVGKMKHVFLDIVEERRLKMRWHLDCSDRIGVIVGYQVQYCKLKEDVACNIQVINVAADVHHVWVENLDPWSYYKVGVAVISRESIGKVSDFLVNRTKVAPPEGYPTNIQSKLVGNWSIDVNWEPPMKANGPIAVYELEYFYIDHKNIKVMRHLNTSSRSVTLRNLMPNAEYFLKMRACNMINKLTFCGIYSGMEHLERTNYGPSGEMASPDVSFINSTYVKVTWNVSSFHHGSPTIERYEVNISSLAYKEHYVVSTSGEKSEIFVALDKLSDDTDLSTDCANSSLVSNKYGFSIRAVTRDDELTFEGPWSIEEIRPAYCEPRVPYFVIIGVAVGSSLFTFVILAYLYKIFNWRVKVRKYFGGIEKVIEEFEIHSTPAYVGDVMSATGVDVPGDFNSCLGKVDSQQSSGLKVCSHFFPDESCKSNTDNVGDCDTTSAGGKTNNCETLKTFYGSCGNKKIIDSQDPQEVDHQSLTEEVQSTDRNAVGFDLLCRHSRVSALPDNQISKQQQQQQEDSISPHSSNNKLGPAVCQTMYNVAVGPNVADMSSDFHSRYVGVDSLTRLSAVVSPHPSVVRVNGHSGGCIDEKCSLPIPYLKQMKTRCLDSSRPPSSNGYITIEQANKLHSNSMQKTINESFLNKQQLQSSHSPLQLCSKMQKSYAQVSIKNPLTGCKDSLDYVQQ